MNPKKIIAATALALAAFTGTTQADLVSDLNTMSAADALAKAIQTENISIEALIADAAAQLAESPELLSALVSEAVKAFPEQAATIVQVAVSQAPAQQAIITSAAVEQLGDNPEALASVQQIAPVPATEFEAEQTELAEPTPAAETPAPVTTPPAPPAARPTTPDKPVPVSPN